MVPVIRELDSSAGPLNFFGAELRRARAAAGLSQEQLGQRVGYSAAQVGKVETGDRAPSLDFAEGCDGALDTGGLFARIYELARRWDGGYPSWFAEWIEAERRATSLSWWEPLLVPGLVQTADYARAIIAAGARYSEDELEELVNGRIDRQAIFERPRPPNAMGVVDEGVLRRPDRRRERSCMISCNNWRHMPADPSITIQIVPPRSARTSACWEASLSRASAMRTGYRVHGVA